MEKRFPKHPFLIQSFQLATAVLYEFVQTCTAIHWGILLLHYFAENIPIKSSQYLDVFSRGWESHSTDAYLTCNAHQWRKFRTAADLLSLP
jgi:hypothetical protein